MEDRSIKSTQSALEPAPCKSACCGASASPIAGSLSEDSSETGQGKQDEKEDTENLR